MAMLLREDEVQVVRIRSGKGKVVEIVKPASPYTKRKGSNSEQEAKETREVMPQTFG